MRQTDVEFRVGLLILLMIIILAGSLYWLQGYKLERNAQLVTVRFRDVGTLSVGDRVTVSGVHRGKVNELTLGEAGVDVELLIYEDVDLRSDATFRIRNLGVMGDRYVAINPGTDSIPLDPSQVVRGLYDTGIPEVMGVLGDMVVELRQLVTSIRTSIGSDSTLGKFNRTVENLARTSEGLARFMDRHGDKLDSSAINFLEASRGFRVMLADNRDRVDSALVRMNRASSGLETVVNRLDTLSQATRRLAHAMESEDGTLQLLLEDRRLYDDLRGTADNIDDLIADIRENPRKYINLKVEIF